MVLFRHRVFPVVFALVVLATVSWLRSEPSAPAKPAASAQDLNPTFRRVPVLVGQLLQQYHFTRQPIDESKARAWIEAYMQALDYNHLIFLQSDLTELCNRYAATLPQRNAEGDLSPAYEIFDLFRRRLDDRMAWVAKRLDQPFTFDKDDYYEIDRSKVKWPANKEEADDLWERRLKFELIQLRLAALDTDKAKPSKPAEDPVQAVRKRFQRFATLSADYDAEDIVQSYLSALASLYDPHSQYMGPSTLADFRIGMETALVGIGAVLTTEDGYCTIKEIIPGGPADLDKRLKINDRITAVAQGDGPYVDVVDMKLRNAVKLIRGEKGSRVRLSIIPADAHDPSVRKDIILVRDKIELTAQQASARILEIPEGNAVRKIGVIDLPSFYGDIGGEDRPGGKAPVRSTTEDVKLLITHLKKQGIEGLILDLRKNGGGLLDEAVTLTGLFINRGPVVQVKNQNGQIEVKSDESPGTLYDGPLIVLTSRQSASASEIVAGALQNYGRALIVGDSSTHGKGTVQAVVELGRFLQPAGGSQPEAGAVKLTISKFYLPNGDSTQNRGVIPDISLPNPNDYLKIGESDSPHALPWDQIKASNFKPVSTFQPKLVETLRERSRQRIQNNELFGLFQEEIQRLRKRMEEGRVSLNEKRRLDEWKTEKQRRELTREKEKSLVDSDDLLQRLVIKNVDGKNVVVPDTEWKRRMQSRLAELEESGAQVPGADLHLRETLGIMGDFLTMGRQTGPSVAAETASAPAS